jgi:hypothetical protein
VRNQAEYSIVLRTTAEAVASNPIGFATTCSIESDITICCAGAYLGRAVGTCPVSLRGVDGAFAHDTVPVQTHLNVASSLRGLTFGPTHV